MKVLILGINYAPELIGTGPYTAGLAEALAARGHQVRAIVGQPYYPEWRPRPGHRLWIRQISGGVDIRRVPHRIPRRAGGPGRLVQQLSFALAALPSLMAQALFWRPDIVLVIAPGLLAAPAGLLAARLSGATSWLHLQDFELEAAVATGLIPQKLGRLLLRAEQAILGAFDRLSTISPAMSRRLESKAVPPGRISEDRNWATIQRPHDRPSSFRQEWQIETPHVALYSGALGRKQGLETLVAAARALQHRDDLIFIICGNGPARPDLEASAADLPNLRFFDLQPPDQLVDLLALASIHILPQIAGAADLVLPSKLPNMLASGRPVIATAEPGSSLAAEVEGCGDIVPPGDAPALAAAIAALLDAPQRRKALGAAASRRAETRWQRETILARFAADLEAAPFVQRAAPAVDPS